MNFAVEFGASGGTAQEDTPKGDRTGLSLTSFDDR